MKQVIRILLVEDDVTLAARYSFYLMCELFEGEVSAVKIKVIVTFNLTEARAALHSEPFHLVITDTCVDSRQPDGDAFVREFRQRFGQEVPIIGMSSSDFYRARMLEAGSNEFYDKAGDCKLPRLGELVKRLLKL